ncbi:S8 family serine peptidase [Streptobacillus ratti]|uniref:S8 family serine peptidase n=1 Tax=Streptobacillus ratti TaxID=1720557 RepID=UPI000932A2BB|nr:S8 family serine peptidase [Streptobacillus ratti]
MSIKIFQFYFVFLFLLTSCSSYDFDEYIVKNLKNKPVEYVSTSYASKKNLGENEDLEEVKKAEKVLKENENPVIIYELLLSRETDEKTKNKYNFLSKNLYDINYNSQREAGFFDNHAFDVTEAFMDTDADGVVSDAEKMYFKDKNVNIRLAKRDEDVLNAVGIINMSYAIVNHNKNFSYLQSNSRYLDKIFPRDINRLEDFLTTKLIDRNYVYNQRLLISAIGNGNFNTMEIENFSNDILNIYQVMSLEMQSLSRSESIFVKNSFKRNNDLIKNNSDFPTSYTDINNTQYIDRLTKDDPQVQALLLRAATVGENGLLKEDQEGDAPKFGSSFSSPRIARLAYDIKEKYPFLTYQQVKQVILGTANHAKDGYLNDNVGWGNANREKALKGPSDFNAGLIDEMKYFKGNYDKIFDENGNRYFYVDIEKGKTYTFENDIVSGLNGDGKNTTHSIIQINGVKYWYDDYQAKKHSYQIPKVLESERLFYSNVAQAGLRKDGEGELVLTGKQEYTAPSQVLKGTLTLKNDSKSDYSVHRDATLNVESKNNKDEEIKLTNIYSEGKVKINSKAHIEKLYGSNKSNIEFGGKEINIDELKVGEYTLIVKNSEKLEIPELKIKNFKNNEDLEKNISNVYLKPVIINEDKIVSVKFVSTLENEFKTLGEIEENKLKDLPSYDRNRKNFFNEYGKIEAMPSSVKAVLLSSSASEVKNLFTDNYSSIIGNVIKNEIDNKYNRTNIILNNLEKENRIYFDTYARTNLLNDKKFSPFVDRHVGGILGYSRKLKNGNRVDLYGIYQYGDVVFNNTGSNKARSTNNLYNIGWNLSHKFFDVFRFNVDNNIGYSRSDVYNSNVSKSLNVKTDILHSLSFNHGLRLGVVININKINTIFKPYAGYTFNFVLAWGKKDKENSKTDIINKLRNIALTKLMNHNVEFGIETDSKINKNISIQNRLVFDYNSLDKIELNQMIAEKLHKTIGKGLDKISVNYNLGVKLRVLEGFNIIGKANLSSKLNIGLNLGLDYNF